MTRLNSSNWAVNDQITAARLQDLNEDLDDLYAYGTDRLRVRAAVSGTALKIDIGAGNVYVGSTLVSYAGATNVSVTNTATNYVEIDASGTIQINTTGWTTTPSTIGRLATVVCSGGVVTSVTIYRTDSIGGLDLIANSSKFGDGSDGALNVTSGTTSIDCTAASGGILVKQYSSFNVSGGATLNLTNVPSSGVHLIILCQGAFTMAGTFDLKNGGSAAGTGKSVSRTSDGTTVLTGGDATAVDAGVTMGQQRHGLGGPTATGSAGGNDRDAAASAGGGGANSVTDANAVTAASGGSASASAPTTALSLTLALVKQISNYFGFTLSCGGGGASGGVAVHISGYSSGTISATSVDGGRGAASVTVICQGNYNMSGTVDQSGTAASGSAATTMANLTGANRGEAAAAGGSSGGAAGCWRALVKGTITNAGTYTQTGGAGVNGTAQNQGTGDGSGSLGTATNGVTGAAGATSVSKIF